MDQREVTAAICWHCQGSGTCDCITCGKTVGAAPLLPGPCAACYGSAFWDRLRPLLEVRGVDIGDPKWWRNDRYESGYKKIFIPKEALQEWERENGLFVLDRD